MGAQSRLIFLIIGVVLFFWFMKSIEQVKVPEKEPEHIENKELKDSLKSDNELLKQEISALEEKSDSLEKKLQEKEVAITKVRRKRDEEIARIDKLHSHELYRFFAEFNTKSRDQ